MTGNRLKSFILGIRTCKGLALWVTVQLAGVIAITVVASLEIASKHSPYHLIWFIPSVILSLGLGVWLGYWRRPRRKMNDR